MYIVSVYIYIYMYASNTFTHTYVQIHYIIYTSHIDANSYICYTETYTITCDAHKCTHTFVLNTNIHTHLSYTEIYTYIHTFARMIC